MSTNDLMDYAESHGHKVDYFPLKKTKAIILDNDGSYIAISNSLIGIEEKETVAHELGHAEFGGAYYRASPFEIKDKARIRANKWAFYRLVPPGEIRAAFKNGVVEP